MKRISNISESVCLQDFRDAITSAADGHRRREEVEYALEHLDEEAERFYNSYKDGSCYSMISYRKLEKTNNNGKKRKIDSPSWETRVYQHLIILKLSPIYESKDNHNGLNCKAGHGITARVKRFSVVHRLKHIFYDRKDLAYVVIADQRKCYEHVTKKVFRRCLRKIIDDKAFVDFATALILVDDKLPIGTPTSPLAHHIVMLEFDIFIKDIAGDSVRYADDNAVFVYDLAEAHSVKWRIKNFWWYKYGIRAKRHTIRIVPVAKALDFCGYIFHRGDKGHSKGYVGVRKSILKKAKKATEENWSCYFGLLLHADSYSLMKSIERNMKLSQLTNTIKLTRSMDAPNIPIREVCDTPITIVDYDLRSDKDGKPNWVKMLIGMQQNDGRVMAREVHGGYQWIVEFLVKAEAEFGKDNLLPIEDVVIQNQCGYIFKDSTNQIKFFDNEKTRIA